MTENYVVILNQEIPMPRNIKENETKKEYKEYLKEYASKYFQEKDKEEFVNKASYISYLIEYSFELDFLVKKLYKAANNFYKKDKWYIRTKNYLLDKYIEKMGIGYYDEEDEVIEETLLTEEEIEELEERIISQIENEELEEKEEVIEVEEIKEKEDKKENIFTKTVSFFKNIFNRDKKYELTEEELEENINIEDELEEIEEETNVKDLLTEVSNQLLEQNERLTNMTVSLINNLKIQEETIKRLEDEVLNLKLKISGYNPNNIMINHAYSEALKEDKQRSEQKRIKSIINKADISDFELRMGSLEASPAIYRDMNKVYVKRK